MKTITQVDSFLGKDEDTTFKRNLSVLMWFEFVAIFFIVIFTDNMKLLMFFVRMSLT